MSLSYRDMCAISGSAAIPSDAPATPATEPEMDAAALREVSQRRPQFLSSRSRNARGALIGAAALSGAAALAAAVGATAVIAGARWLRSTRLRGKVVLITGSSRGLGLAMAEEFARRGARIVLTARDSEELERARALLLSRGAAAASDQILMLSADLRKPEEAERLVQRVTRTWGRIDVLVNNAGVITVGPVENQRAEDFREVMETNFFTGVHCVLAVLPQMLERRSGDIVNIASIGGKVAVPHLLPYTASKFAEVGFSEGLHAELRSKGIHVLTVCPGLMRTGSHVNALFYGDAEREYRWFSLGATVPGISTSARHAARKILHAVIGRKTEIAITPQAIVAARLAQVAPELTARAMSLVSRMLPAAKEEKAGPIRGMDVRSREPISAKSLGWSAARRYNEVGQPGAKA